MTSDLTIAALRRMREHMQARVGFRLLKPYWGKHAGQTVRFDEDRGYEIMAMLGGEWFSIDPNPDKSIKAYEIVWIEDHD